MCDFRGIFVVEWKGEVIFADNVEFRISDLPPWTPQVIVDRRTIDGGRLLDVAEPADVISVRFRPHPGNSITSAAADKK